MQEVDYWRPNAPAEAELEIKNSRFIAYLFPVTNLAEADEAKAKIRALHPNARHHCWAQVVGEPFDVHACGASDDGEPGGTAGRPMLAVLTGKPVGFVMVMVVRYFGGIKLGTGGLVRAYSGAVRQVLDAAEWRLCVPMAYRQFSIAYSLHQSVLHLLAGFDGVVIKNEFSDSVTLTVALPKEQQTGFEQQLFEMTSGSIEFNDYKVSPSLA